MLRLEYSPLARLTFVFRRSFYSRIYYKDNTALVIGEGKYLEKTKIGFKFLGFPQIAFKKNSYDLDSHDFKLSKKKA